MKFLLSFFLFVLTSASLIAQTPKASVEPTQSVVLSEEGDSPVILYDKREITQGELSKMDQSKIGDIKILTGIEAKERFGKYGKYGAIVISSALQAPVVTETTTPIVPAEKVSDAMSEEVKMSFGADLEAYVIIDGKASTMKVLESMEPEQIESMMVLKRSIAVEKYGEIAKEGAIEVTTKQ